MGGNPSDLLRVTDADDAVALDHVRRLMREFAAEFESVVAGVFAVQGFAAEVAGLPGRYAPPTGCLLLAWLGDDPVGTVALRDLGRGVCEMKRLYVARSGRGRGVGRLLAGEVIRRAEGMRHVRMVLDTLPEMPEAIALYRSVGFEATAPYWGHPTAGAVFLGRDLKLDETIRGDAR